MNVTYLQLYCARCHARYQCFASIGTCARPSSSAHKHTKITPYTYHTLPRAPPLPGIAVAAARASLRQHRVDVGAVLGGQLQREQAPVVRHMLCVPRADYDGRHLRRACRTRSGPLRRRHIPTVISPLPLNMTSAAHPLLRHANAGALSMKHDNPKFHTLVKD